MRYAPDHKEKTRERVLAVASRALKRDGAGALGVAGVMAEAGLTHGAFYAHFPSREALIAEALDAALAEMKARYFSVIEGKPPARALSDYIDFYVSRRHRDHPGDGCILTALGSDIARLSDPARDAFARGHAQLARALTNLLDASVTDDLETLALSMTAEMVGAVTLARATADPIHSDRLLAASRAALKARAGVAEEPAR
ncbi:MAG: TetR family transcriptional regulator [Caulobacter sp.]|nr:TetR family transcriptional regulator [Caulobacter sp.]